MSATRTVAPLDEPFAATPPIPGSKSLTNRALICAAFATGTSTLRGALFADDTTVMAESLGRLGAALDLVADDALIRVDGNEGRLPNSRVELFAGASGTTSRFLLAAVAGGEGTYVISGDASLSARPMGDGVAVLRQLGVEADTTGRLPITVTGPVRSTEPVTVRGDVSSQFLSGLLLAAPTWPGGRTIRVDGALVSRPYVDMTTAVMRAFGAVVDEIDDGGWHVHDHGYRSTDYAIEPDASAASYFFAAAAICGGRVRVDGLGRSSVQGDLRFVDVLAQMGAIVTVDDHSTTVEGTGRLHGGHFDLGDFSDTAQTLAVVSAFADGPTRITGIGFIRAKETDRIAALAEELGRVGIAVDVEQDAIVVHPGTPHGAVVQTYDDHRMAMSFAVLGLRVPGISIADPDCVSKTFPGYFGVLDSLRAGPRSRH